MSYQYKCPNCGKIFNLKNYFSRVNCRDCGTSWNVCKSNDYGTEVACIIMGAVFSPIFPVFGGAIIIGSAISIFSKIGKK